MGKLAENKVVTVEEAYANYESNKSYFVGGFGPCGTPDMLLEGFIAKSIDHIIMITNDAGASFIPANVKDRLTVDEKISKFIVTHCAANRHLSEKVNSGKIDLELVCQGSFVERIRSAGFGLGGVLTKTGVGTEMESGKKKIEIDGVTYLVEEPLKADIALIHAYKADEFGNLCFRRESDNFSKYMAMAADKVIVEAENIVKNGDMNDNEIMLSGIFVDMIVKAERTNNG